jgi:hypothetical protein
MGEARTKTFSFKLEAARTDAIAAFSERRRSLATAVLQYCCAGTAVHVLSAY